MPVRDTIKQTKIIATIGPATDDPAILEQILRAGVNGCRLNFSHGKPEERDEQIKNIREISKKIGRRVAIIQDLQGPKIRLGELKDEAKFTINAGDKIGLTEGIAHDGGNNLPSQFDFSGEVKPGESIYLFDGKIQLVVDEVQGKTVWTTAKNAGWVVSHKSINLPDTNFDQGRIMTDKDLADLSWSAEKDFDYTAISFVHKASDLDFVREEMKKRGISRPIITKLETKAGALPENLEDIVKNSDGVMVARGDLATEAGAVVVPVVEREILRLCRKHGKFSVVATQMLASMIDNPQPTRAEVSDVETAVFLGADNVMLSDETAMGKYPVAAVEMMKQSVLYAQKRAEVGEVQNFESPDYPVAKAAIELARGVAADAIVVETETGQTAREIANLRPDTPILAVSRDERVANRASLLGNTLGFVGEGEDYGWNTLEKIAAAGFFGEQKTQKIVIVHHSADSNVASTIQLRELS